MRRSALRFTAVLALAVLSGLAVAQDPAVKQAIKAKIQAAIPQLPVREIRAAQLPGLYEVELVNGERLFTDAEVSYFVAGDLFQITDNRLVNLSEVKRNSRRAEQLATIPDEDKIIFTPQQRKKATVTVFTDVDCGYCRRLHQQMAGYLEHGIEIQYLAYPRAGVGSNSYQKIVSAWCADNKQEAITKLKKGEKIASITCDNPVVEHFRLGGKLGITGTPSLVFESGQLYPGYVEPDRLAKLLGI